MPASSYIFDSNALVLSALVKRTEKGPWQQFVQHNEKSLASFSTISTSIIKAYSMCPAGVQRTEYYRNLDSVLSPYWSQLPQYEIIDLHDKSNVKKIGEFVEQYLTTYSFEECQIAYICKEYYPGAEVCGVPSGLYQSLNINLAYPI